MGGGSFYDQRRADEERQDKKLEKEKEEQRSTFGFLYDLLPKGPRNVN